MADDMLIGRNSVLEALKAERTLNKIFLQEGQRQGSVKEVINLARQSGIPVETVPSARLDALSGQTVHQGVIAFASPIAYYELEDVLAIAERKKEPAFLLVLDEIQDPHNVGAIIRTAAAAGVHGVLLPKRRSCQITPSVVKASAGMAEYVPVVRIGNVVQTLEKLKKLGLWVAGADMNGTVLYQNADFSYPVVLVIGGEGKGISRLVKENCDLLLQIPMSDNVSSLNASVAAALLMYEVLRKRSINGG